MSMQNQAPPDEALPSPFSTPKQLYREINARIEWIEDYKPGGFHPVHVGDLLSDSKYKILLKRGYGSYSTVWLAKDRTSGYVTIKILIADDEVPQNEVTIFEILSRSQSYSPSRSSPYRDAA